MQGTRINCDNTVVWKLLTVLTLFRKYKAEEEVHRSPHAAADPVVSSTDRRTTPHTTYTSPDPPHPHLTPPTHH